VVFIVAPKILGGNDGVPEVGGSTPATMAGSILLEDVVSRRYGDDVVIEGVPSFDTSGVGPTRVHR
jgi:riboflavin biosynthesis pyrimidine reductase